MSRVYLHAVGMLLCIIVNQEHVQRPSMATVDKDLMENECAWQTVQVCHRTAVHALLPALNLLHSFAVLEKKTQ
jgi:hypothetical protein